MTNHKDEFTKAVVKGAGTAVGGLLVAAAVGSFIATGGVAAPVSAVKLKTGLALLGLAGK